MIKKIAAAVLALLIICTAAFSPVYAEETPAPPPAEPIDTPDTPADPTPDAPPTEPTPAPPDPTPAPPSPSPTPTPSPSPSASPSPNPTASPSPTPTPAPKITFSGPAEVVVVLMDTGYDPNSDIYAHDEYGDPVSVYVKSTGNYTASVEGDYRVIFGARHPVTGREYTFERRVCVRMSEEQQRYKILFYGSSELNFKVGDVGANLLGDATACDENGQQVAVTVKDRGGFDGNVIGTYTVTYAAVHPVLGATFTESRPVNVLSEDAFNSLNQPANPLEGKSNSRYYKYVKYREAIYNELQPRMTGVKTGLKSRLDLIADALGYADYRIVRSLPALEDDSGIVEGEALTKSVAQTFSPAQTELYEELDALNIHNWSDILAVFVATSSLDVDDPLDLYNLRKISFEELEDVFWSMTDISYHVENGELWMVLTSYDAFEMMERYNMEQSRRDSLEELMQPEFQSVFASLTGDPSFTSLSQADVEGIKASLPEGLSVGRESVIMAAYTLLDKVDYFWGGKYYELGWNASWGMPRLVTSLRSKTTGTVRPYGLDCSGFVTWSFINGAEDTSMLQVVGTGSTNQWNKSVAVGWDEAKPGDLAFRRTPSSSSINHVGIIASVEDDGTYMVIHCSSSKGGVVVTEAWSSGFRYIRRPFVFLSEEELDEAAKSGRISNEDGSGELVS